MKTDTELLACSPWETPQCFYFLSFLTCVSVIEWLLPSDAWAIPCHAISHYTLFYLTLLLDRCRYFPVYKHFEKRKKKIVCANSKVPEPLALPSVSVGSPSLNAAVSSNQPGFPCFQFFASSLPTTPNRALPGIGVSPFPALRSCCRLHLSSDQAM